MASRQGLATRVGVGIGPEKQFKQSIEQAKRDRDDWKSLRRTFEKAVQRAKRRDDACLHVDPEIMPRRSSQHTGAEEI
jgi:hypothetical protein